MTTAIKKESVWDYPRPPAIEPTRHHLKVLLDGIVLADTTHAYRILETSHPPTYYIPPSDVKMEYFKQNARSTFCEWKGAARYYDVVVNGKTINSRVWFYPQPSSKYAALKDHLSFYATPFDCYVDDERVQAQDGDFYGGWVTSWIDGGKKGMKGGPGTWGW
ncbi:hypothetical protein SmJEL517_g00296 [Synchytrium microbalum]|uniref:DUF427 domain-containing protein n=1 Tax=Synchytrium microbalum TaxID=1806994 RepID=A0A507CFC4_9FUNG|nr:uncharacterized protein SmJEL517_g00296 [Synchytrium microbalum]TPX38058.1 hypothetical protein SmJEL517_g00296 [Synchytrium microbalum]